MTKCHKNWFTELKWKSFFICTTWREVKDHDLDKVNLDPFCINLVRVGGPGNFLPPKGMKEEVCRLGYKHKNNMKENIWTSQIATMKKKQKMDLPI